MSGFARDLTRSVDGPLREMTKPVIRLTTHEATTKKTLNFIRIPGCGKMCFQGKIATLGKIHIETPWRKLVNEPDKLTNQKPSGFVEKLANCVDATPSSRSYSREKAAGAPLLLCSARSRSSRLPLIRRGYDQVSPDRRDRKRSPLTAFASALPSSRRRCH